MCNHVAQIVSILHSRSFIGCHIAFAAEGKRGFNVVNFVTMVSSFLPRRQCCQRWFEGSFLGPGNFQRFELWESSSQRL